MTTMNEFYEVIENHWCTPGCDEGCRISKIRYYRTKSEVIETRPGLTDEDLARLQALFASKDTTSEGS